MDEILTMLFQLNNRYNNDAGWRLITDGTNWFLQWIADNSPWSTWQTVAEGTLEAVQKYLVGATDWARDDGNGN